MKRKQKRVISLIMTLLMVASLLPTNLLVSRITAKAEGNTVTLIDFENSKGTITAGSTNITVNASQKISGVSVDTIKFTSSYSSSNTNYAELTVDDGFKSGDVISFVGFVTSNKVAYMALYGSSGEAMKELVTSTDSLEYVSDTSSIPNLKAFTFKLEEDVDKLYLARASGSATTAFITTLTVTRTTTDESETDPPKPSGGEDNNDTVAAGTIDFKVDGALTSTAGLKAEGFSYHGNQHGITADGGTITLNLDKNADITVTECMYGSVEPKASSGTVKNTVEYVSGDNGTDGVWVITGAEPGELTITFPSGTCYVHSIDVKYTDSTEPTDTTVAEGTIDFKVDSTLTGTAGLKAEGFAYHSDISHGITANGGTITLNLDKNADITVTECMYGSVEPKASSGTVKNTVEYVSGDNGTDGVWVITGAEPGELTITFPSGTRCYIHSINVKYVEEHTHTMTKTEEVAATCIKEGKNAYYKCDGCGKYFEDVEGTKEIANIDTWGVIEMIEHAYAEDFTVDKEATATEAGSKSRHCTTDGCDAKTDVTEIPKLVEEHTHTLTKTEAVPATCIAVGKNAYYKCDGCGKCFEDAEGTKEIANIDTWGVIETIDHTYATEYTVDKAATTTATGEKSRHCTTPGCTARTDVTVIEALGEDHTHTITKTEAVAATCIKEGKKAYYTCGDCGACFEDAEGTKEIADIATWGVIEKTAHNFAEEYTVDKEATATEAGSKSRHCTTEGCDEKTDVTVIPATGTQEHTHTMTKTEAVAATCIAVGKQEYYKCNECNKYFEDAEGTTEIADINTWGIIEKTAHTYAAEYTVDKKPTATEAGSKSRHCTTPGCDEKTDVTVIEALGEDHTHTLTKIEEVAATCIAVGKQAYYTCEECGACFEDAEGTTEIADIDAWGVIAKTAHNFAAEYTVDKEATATEAGSKSRHCTTPGCDEKTDVTVIPATGTQEHTHTLTKTEAVAATCIAVGKQEYYKCNECNKYFEDAEGTTEIADIDAWGVIAKTAHNFAAEYTVDKEATATEAGSKSRHCTTPGCDEKTDVTVIPATGTQEHTHTMTKTEAVAATCIAVGKQEYYKCNECNKYFEDAEGTKEIADIDAWGVIEKTAHNFAAEYTVDKEATATEAGSKSRHCTTPGCDEKTDVTVIPATGTQEQPTQGGLRFEEDLEIFKYYENDEWVEDKYGYVEFDGATFLVANGVAAIETNGLAQDPNNTDNWYYVAAGKVQEQVSDLVEYDGEWFYVESGKLDITFSGYADYNGGKFLVAVGRIVGEAQGLVQDPNNEEDWYYLADGQVVDYTGLALYDEHWFYVVDGKLDVSYVGTVEYDGATFSVVKGVSVTD